MSRGIRLRLISQQEQLEAGHTMNLTFNETSLLENAESRSTP